MAGPDCFHGPANHPSESLSVTLDSIHLGSGFHYDYDDDSAKVPASQYGRTSSKPWLKTVLKS